MEKQDLVAGKHVVELRNGGKFLVLTGSPDQPEQTIRFVSSNNYFSCIQEFDRNLYHSKTRDNDIVNVFEILGGFTLSRLKSGGCLKLVSTRKECLCDV